MTLLATPTECGCARGCVYSVATRRPRFCGGCKELQQTLKKARQRAAYRAAHPVQRETKYSIKEPEAVRVKKIAAVKAVKEKREKAVRVTRIEKQAAAVGPRARRQRGPKPSKTHSSIMALWSRAHDNSPLRRKYPTKDALRQAGLQPGHRSERVHT